MHLAVNETAYLATFASAPAGRVLARTGLFAHPPTPLTLASSLRVDPSRGARVTAGYALVKKERKLCEVREALQGRILVTQTSDQCPGARLEPGCRHPEHRVA